MADAPVNSNAFVLWSFATSSWGYATGLDETPIPGDFNGDSEENEQDFQILIANPIDFGATGPQGDADLDGDIDFDDLLIWLANTDTSGVPGDYNGDAVIDAADYIVWRKTLGSTTDLWANGDNTGTSAGIIDIADYTFWRSHFGDTAMLQQESPGMSIRVPESSTGQFLQLIALSLFLSKMPRFRPICSGQSTIEYC